MSAAVPQWLLMDVPGTSLAGLRLPHAFDQVPRFWLFEGTEFHLLREQGPQLIDLRSSPALVESCHSEQHLWRGLLVVSKAPASQLLAHFRRMLMVMPGLHHRALLSYYSPYTASYFFDACNALELSRWLGPINQLRWFGGTWADHALGSQCWQQLSNPGLAVSPLEIEESLSPRQLEKLQTCLLEHHAWRWSESTGTDYNCLWSHVQEGLALGFSERPALDGWLWLRLQHPGALPARTLPGLTQQERLDALRYLWQNNQP
ncbi:DUF4123 domain-containing protein [Rhodococcus sp. IEGM1300]